MPLVFALIAAAPATADSPIRAKHGARTYYVDSRKGNDSRSGRSPAQAWRSLARAADARLHGGDRLLLRRGGSWQAELDLAGSGTASRPALVSAYGTGRPPLIGSGSTCVRITGSFIRLTGIDVRDCMWAGVSLVGSFIRVDHVRVQGAAAGIEVTPGSRGDKIENRLIDNNHMSVLSQTPNDDSRAFGILLRGRGTLVAGNRIVGSDAFSYDYGRDGSAVEIYGGRDDTIVRNLAIDDNAFTELGNAQSRDNTYAYNLFVTNVPGATFRVTRGSKDRYGPVRGTPGLQHNGRPDGEREQGSGLLRRLRAGHSSPPKRRGRGLARLGGGQSTR